MRRVPKPYIPKEIFAALITTLLVETAGLEPAPRVRSRLPIVPIYALPAFQPSTVVGELLLTGRSFSR